MLSFLCRHVLGLFSLRSGRTSRLLLSTACPTESLAAGLYLVVTLWIAWRVGVCCLCARKVCGHPRRFSITVSWLLEDMRVLFVPKPVGGSLPRPIGCWWHAHAVWITQPHGGLSLCQPRSVVCQSPGQRPTPRRLWHFKYKINKELCVCLWAKEKMRGCGCFCLICNPMEALLSSQPLQGALLWCLRQRQAECWEANSWLNQVGWMWFLFLFLSCFKQMKFTSFSLKKSNKWS